MHFCMGELAEVALYSSDSACEMKVQKPACHKAGEAATLDVMSCCEDQYMQVEAQNEILPGVKASLSPIHFVQIAIIYAPDLLIASFEQDKSYLYHYTPPIIVRDISILHDTFLI